MRWTLHTDLRTVDPLYQPLRHWTGAEDTTHALACLDTGASEETTSPGETNYASRMLSSSPQQRDNADTILQRALEPVGKVTSVRADDAHRFLVIPSGSYAPFPQQADPLAALSATLEPSGELSLVAVGVNDSNKPIIELLAWAIVPVSLLFLAAFFGRVAFNATDVITRVRFGLVPFMELTALIVLVKLWLPPLIALTARLTGNPTPSLRAWNNAEAALTAVENRLKLEGWTTIQAPRRSE